MPFGLSAGRRLLVDRFDVHANQVHKRGFTRAFPPKTGRHRETIDGFDPLRLQLVHVSRERVVHRSSRQNHRHDFLFRVHVDNFCRRRWCMWELTNFEDDPPPEAVASLLEATSFWGVAPLLVRAQSLGIPCVLEDAWGPVCVAFGVLPGAKAPKDDVTMWWNRVDIVPNVPKCPVRVDVVPILPKCPVPASVLYRYRYRLR